MAILLGLDPGLASTGWAIGVLDLNRRLHVTAGGVFHTEIDRDADRAGDDNMRRVGELFAELSRTCDEFSVQAIATEGISIVRPAGGAPQSGMAIKQGMVFGALAAVAANVRVPLIQVYPQRLKKAVTGSAKATKDEVIAAVQKLHPEADIPKRKGDWEHYYDSIGAMEAAKNEPAIVALITAPVRERTVAGDLSGSYLSALRGRWGTE